VYGPPFIAKHVVASEVAIPDGTTEERASTVTAGTSPSTLWSSSGGNFPHEEEKFLTRRRST
jgi:hypothetical protein